CRAPFDPTARPEVWTWSARESRHCPLPPHRPRGGARENGEIVRQIGPNGRSRRLPPEWATRLFGARISATRRRGLFNCGRVANMVRGSSRQRKGEGCAQGEEQS